MNLKTWCFLFLLLPLAAKEVVYTYGADSVRQAGVPVGEVTRHEWKSAIYPGTLRQVYLYIPKQYDGSEEANLAVFQDGHAHVGEEGHFRVPVVFDNLIHQEKVPVTIAVMVNPGLYTESLEGRQGWKSKFRSHRSVEYDTPDGTYARFLEKEIIPWVAAKYRVTEDPAKRLISGTSSGGICAFTVAWERPDLFRNVISHIGSFVNIRGGHEYPAWIRKEEKRDIRVFLQDGKADLDNEHGSWWLGNLQMEAALRFKGYDFRFIAGEGGHDGKHGGTLLPEAIQWVWR